MCPTNAKILGTKRRERINGNQDQPDNWSQKDPGQKGMKGDKREWKGAMYSKMGTNHVHNYC